MNVRFRISSAGNGFAIAIEVEINARSIVHERALVGERRSNIVGTD
jgi:hypothetical protein